MDNDIFLCNTDTTVHMGAASVFIFLLVLFVVDFFFFIFFFFFNTSLHVYQKSMSTLST